MRRMIKKVTAAESATPDREQKFNDQLKEVSDEFDYLTSGLEQLFARGKFDNAKSALDTLQDALADMIDEVSLSIAEEV